MNKKRKFAVWLIACAVAVLLFRIVWIYVPSDAKVIFNNDATGVSFEESLSREETVAMKKILWGKIRWPKALYGFPACGFGRNCAIIIDGTRYMLAWDSCGTLCVEDASSQSGPYFYMDISDSERQVIDEMFNSRGAR